MKRDRVRLRLFALLVLLAAASICGGLPVFPSSSTETCSLRPFSDFVWLDSVSGPPDTLYTDTLIDVRGRAMLHAGQDAPGTRVQIRFRRIGSGASRYYDTFDLAPGESVPVEWRVELLPESAQYFASESVMGSTSAESSYVTWQFWVLPGHGGVNDAGRQPAIGDRPKPSMLRGIPPDAVAFDALGNQVLAPKAGVYFVRATPTDLPRKVILVR
jgi:hypothetical protein